MKDITNTDAIEFLTKLYIPVSDKTKGNMNNCMVDFIIKKLIKDTPKFPIRKNIKDKMYIINGLSKNVLTCPVCGYELNDEFCFCPKCGQVLADNNPNVFESKVI